ncbi:MAG TPA: response regulator transcription factor [Pyrinomonadaceae bacterium]|jgi:DNA-binding NarL/FixJ family response regulator|nr:response regulator transcription factor [Pyrinomonadaceae bacterium]
MKRIRLLIADDHVMFAQGLESLLRDEFQLLGTAGNGEELVEATKRLQPDVILVDISMPVLNGFDAVRQITESGTNAKIIFLTMHDDATLVSEAFRCGASGYILKHAAGEELVNAIREVAQGNNYVSPLVTNLPAESSMVHTQKTTITPRQREVLKLISRGLTMKEIASELNISTRTAETHKYEMMQTLGVETTADLIRYSLRLGLIS